MCAAVGMKFHGTTIAYLEHNKRFLAPVRAGDTLTSTWTVAELLPKPQRAGGVVVLKGVAVKQDSVAVADAEGKILVGTRPPAPPSHAT